MQTDNATKPTKPVIIYDGECNFCLNGIRRIQNKDQADQFSYTPKQTPDLYSHYPQLEAIESKEGMRFVDASGRSTAERIPSTRFIDDSASIAISHGSTLFLSFGRC